MNDIERLVKNWNQSTVESLNKSILSEDNFLYKNRLEAFKSFHSIEDFEKIKSTIRYNFLLKIHEDKDLGSEYYIVEANKSGEVYEIRNLLIYKVSDNNFKLKLYVLENSEWKYKSETFFASKEEIFKQKNKHCEFNTGINKDDLIVSYFKQKKIIYSEYYLFTTFPKNDFLSEELFNSMY
jgi:hypothetical protein